MATSPARINGYDMTIDQTIGLTLYRDGRTPAVQGGSFGQVEEMRASGGRDHPIVFGSLAGGMGGADRLVPNTFPLTIDGCTRFTPYWTPGGEKVRLAALPNGSGGRPPGEIRSMLPFDGGMLVAAGGVLYRIDHPWSSWSVWHTVDATEEIQDVRLYNGIPVLGTRLTASGAPGRLHVYSSGSWVRSTTASRHHLEQAYFVINNQGAWRLVANDTKTSFKFISTFDPVALLDNTAWASEAGAGYPVGDGYPITNIVGAPLILFFTTESGLWHVQADGRSARIADWSGSISPENGKAAYFAFGGVYASHGRSGLVRVDVASLNVQWEEQACSPGFGHARVTPIHGANAALTQDGEWLVDVVDNGTDSFVCYGRPKKISEQLALTSIQSTQEMTWYGSEATLWGQRATAVEQATLGPDTRPLLWVGATEGSTPVVSQVSLSKLGTPLEDYLAGGPHRFTPLSWLYLPREDFGQDRGAGWASTKKIFSRLELSAEYLERYVSWIDVFMNTNADDGHRIFWDRALEDDAETLWTLVGRMDRPDRASLVPGASVQSGRRAGILFAGHADREHPFAWSGAKLRGIPVLEQSERRSYRVVAGKARRANRSLTVADRASALNDLWALQWADPVKLLDHTGAQVVMKVDEGMRYDEVRDPDGKYVTAVTFSGRILRRPFYWGQRYRWGTDITWS